MWPYFTIPLGGHINQVLLHIDNINSRKTSTKLTNIDLAYLKLEENFTIKFGTCTYVISWKILQKGDLNVSGQLNINKTPILYLAVYSRDSSKTFTFIIRSQM